MADPALGLPELLQGDPSAYIRQNNRNLVVARLLSPELKSASPQATVPTDADAGDMYLVDAHASSWSTTDWPDASEFDVAIALSDLPSDPAGWSVITPSKGMIVHDGTNGKMWDGTAWTNL